MIGPAPSRFGWRSEIMDETPLAPARVGNAPGTLIKTWLVSSALGIPLGVLLGIVVGLPGLLIGAGIAVWAVSKAFHLVGTWPYLLVLVATMFGAIVIGFPIMAVAINRLAS
jgi:hypothetical protein